MASETTKKTTKKAATKTAKKAAAKSAQKATKTATKKTTKQTAKPTPKDEEFAVIESGGKQYIVAVGDTVLVERLSGELKEGDKVEFDKVLMVDDGQDATIGTPYIKGAKVTGTYQGEKKGKKLNIIRFEAKSNRDRNVGHRQKYSQVAIEALK